MQQKAFEHFTTPPAAAAAAHICWRAPDLTFSGLNFRWWLSAFWNRHPSPIGKVSRKLYHHRELSSNFPWCQRGGHYSKGKLSSVVEEIISTIEEFNCCSKVYPTIFWCCSIKIMFWVQSLFKFHIFIYILENVELWSQEL